MDKITEALDRLKNSSMEIGKSIYSQSDNNDSSTTEEPQAEEADRSEEANQSEEDKKKEEEKK